MEFDDFAIVLLATNPDAPADVDDSVWDAHLAHLASLHDSGDLIAAGPVSHSRLRGVLLLRRTPERARELAEADPAVRAGVFAIEIVPWRVPHGVVTYNAGARMPRSTTEASS